jgi:hypothetical protein
MVQNVHEKLNAGVPWKKQILRRRKLFTSKLDLNLQKKLNKSATVGDSFTCCCNLDTSEGSEMWRWTRMEIS